jgi:hypothetical protein
MAVGIKTGGFNDAVFCLNSAKAGIIGSKAADKGTTALVPHAEVGFRGSRHPF